MISNSQQIINSASILKSIGHPIRIQIIILLGQYTEMTVTQLSEKLNVEQPVMSLHLGVLRKKNIIHSIKKGKKSIYSINDVSVKQIVNMMYNTRL
tara:strand:+ start:222 stop:509 length:288 start_codon:yes stop_codon:yes gene_type:complete